MSPWTYLSFGKLPWHLDSYSRQLESHVPHLEEDEFLQTVGTYLKLMLTTSFSHQQAETQKNAGNTSKPYSGGNLAGYTQGLNH